MAMGRVHGNRTSLKQERIELGSVWTAPRDGTLVCGGRARYDTAYLFINDKIDNVYVGMLTIEKQDHYGTVMCPVLAGHTYEMRRQHWLSQGDLFVYEE